MSASTRPERTQQEPFVIPRSDQHRAAVRVSPLAEHELGEADRVFRLAFGTALGLPEPSRFADGAEVVRSRFRLSPEGSFKAEADGELVGCAFVTAWGRAATFGPLAVRPDYWNRGAGRLLWEARMPLLDRWGITHASLFSRTEPKNLHLYGEFGFSPGFLTALTVKQLAPTETTASWSGFSERSPAERTALLRSFRELAESLQPGLDLEREVLALDDSGSGDTIVVGDGGESDGFAVCHAGAGSEAGPDTLYVKFAAVAPGKGAAGRFERLVAAYEGYAARRGLRRIVAGVNTGRREAYAAILAAGYAPFAYGVAMHRPDDPGYDRPGAFVIDDRR